QSAIWRYSRPSRRTMFAARMVRSSACLFPAKEVTASRRPTSCLRVFHSPVLHDLVNWAQSIRMPLCAGTRLGPYEILTPLGAGGMGEVYRARDPRMGREVAIKISAQRYTDRFEREVRAVAALNHANICQVYDVGPNYLVMELIEGPTLADRIGAGA